MRPVNYIYFCALFVILAALHLFHVYLASEGLGEIPFFFYLTAVGQSLLECGVAFLVASFLLKKGPKIIYPIFISFTFFLFLCHVVDFPLVRIMDMSIWYTFNVLRGMSLQNFVEMLYATNIPLSVWIMGAIFLMAIFTGGMLFFRFTERLAQRKALENLSRVTAFSLVAALSVLCFLDFHCGSPPPSKESLRLLKALPWKKTFFSYFRPQISLKGNLRPIFNEAQVYKKVETVSLTPLKKPNIFIFVAESLREDYLTKEVAPHLATFKENGLFFKKAISSANYTQGSWFSLLQGRYPLYWEKMRKPRWKTGSLPINILKQSGYQVHLYTSARFEYYEMGEVLFGKKMGLLDTAHFFRKEHYASIWERDAQCIHQLKEDIKGWENEGGHLFLIFLDCTHFDYSWPPTENNRFTPIVDNINYLKLTYSRKDLEGIKNRYKNAVFYLDSLFGKFLAALDASKMAEEATIVFTADHAEEFWEQGNIFHASSLSSLQTEIPLYYRFGKNFTHGPVEKNLSSHIDVFPTLLHYVYGQEVLKECFDGVSIFSEVRRPFTLSTRFNANQSPYEFMLHNGENKALFRFLNQGNIYRSKALEIMGKATASDHPLPLIPEEITSEFKSAFDYLFLER